MGISEIMLPFLLGSKRTLLLEVREFADRTIHGKYL